MTAALKLLADGIAVGIGFALGSLLFESFVKRFRK